MVSSAETLCLLSVLNSSRERFATRPAVEDDRCCLTHDDLHDRADQFAAVLTALNLPAKSVIGIYMDGSTDYVTVMLGVLKAGMIFMPLNTEFPPVKLRAILEKTLPTLLVTDQNLAGDLHDKVAVDKRASGPPPEILVFPVIDQNHKSFERAMVESDAGSDLPAQMLDACYIFTTSGSTGVPKAILGSYRGLGHFIRWETAEFGFDETTRGSLLSPVTFDVSLRDIFTPLAVGGCVCIPAAETIRDPAGLFQWMRDSRITLTHIVPTLFRILTRSIRDQQGTMPLPDLQHILLAGEASYGSDVERWRQAAGSSAHIVNLYGPSETTLAKLFCRIADSTVAAGDSLPIGTPIPDTEVMIIADGHACAVGEPGEIYLKTPFRSKGYFNDPELTARQFVKNPLTGDADDIVYQTGDMGAFLPDGKVKFLGRLDGQVKLHGKRTDLGEIETALREFPDVLQAAVALKKGKDDSQRLVAYIVAEEGKRLSVEHMRMFLREKLPDYMMPQAFVHLNALPLTHSGKVDRNALPDPGRQRPDLAVPYVAPKNEEEALLCGIWEKVLEIDGVGTRDGFFDLGGSSVLGMSAVELIRKVFKVNLPIVRLFEYPDVALLAEYLRTKPDHRAAFAGLDDRARRRRAMVNAGKQRR